MCNTNPNVIYVLFFVNRCKYTSFLLIMKFFCHFFNKNHSQEEGQRES